MRIKMQKRFSEKFKKSTIIRTQNRESQLSVASSLGISYKTLNRWVIKAKRQMPSENISLSEENARLRKALKEREAEIAFLKKRSGVLRKDAVTRYAFLEHRIRSAEVGQHAALPVTRACHLLGVSVSGFYAWRSSDKEHQFGVVHTDAFILETLKAEIKTLAKTISPMCSFAIDYLGRKGSVLI